MQLIERIWFAVECSAADALTVIPLIRFGASMTNAAHMHASLFPCRLPPPSVETFVRAHSGNWLRLRASSAYAVRADHVPETDHNRWPCMWPAAPLQTAPFRLFRLFTTFRRVPSEQINFAILPSTWIASMIAINASPLVMRVFAIYSCSVCFAEQTRALIRTGLQINADSWNAVWISVPINAHEWPINFSAMP